MAGDNLAVLPGGAGHVRLTSLPRQSALAATDIAVRMLYAPVNPADLLAIDGRYAFDLDPSVPLGAEGVGRIEAVGEGVADLHPGDLVLPLSRGNWCRYRVLQRADVMALPMGTGLQQGAMLRINPPTAFLLIGTAQAQAGDILVQNAAASTVATWVRAIAAQRDLMVIDVLRRHDPALPEALIDGSDLAERVRAMAGGRPVQAALDCVAGAASGRMADCLSPGGRLIVFGHLSGDPVSIRSQALTGGSLSVQGFSLRPSEAALGDDARHRMFAELVRLHDASNIVIPLRDVVPIAQAERAIALARTVGRGRVLIDLS